MRACIVPAGLEDREYGCLLGEVRRVAERPGDPRRRLLALGGEEAAAGLRRRGPLVEVEVALARDSRTLTGYRWSASRGPGAALASGTPAAGSIRTRRYRPLELLLPARSGERER
jgi:HlyD family secretion protein